MNRSNFQAVDEIGCVAKTAIHRFRTFAFGSEANGGVAAGFAREVKGERHLPELSMVNL
jgi:hypothetical protein